MEGSTDVAYLDCHAEARSWSQVTTTPLEIENSYQGQMLGRQQAK